MSETATSPTPVEATATPETEPVQASNGTATPSGSEAAGAAPSEETFFSGDPNSLPPELKQAYTNMLKDYKQKTQSVAEVRKKAEAYDQVASRPDFKDWWSGKTPQEKADFKEQKAVVEKKIGEKISDEEFQKSLESKDAYLSMHERIAQHVLEKAQKEIDDLKQYKSVNEAKSIVDSFATEMGQDGKPLRPDFDSLNEDGLINGYIMLSAPEKGYTPQQYQAKLNEAYSWAKNLSQKYYEKGKQEALKRVEQKVATSTNPPTQPAKGAYTGPDPKKVTPREAMELAKRGIRIPQVYD